MSVPTNKSWAWWCMPVIQLLGIMGQTSPDMNADPIQKSNQSKKGWGGRAPA
jgi:hypothetical protein